nr:hypothetical protein [Propionivibrio sp.]
MRVFTYAASAVLSDASCLLILIQWATVDTGIFTSDQVSADSALAAPSAASAAEFVKEASLVNSMALLVVVVAGISDSMENGRKAPATIPGLRSGATVASAPVSVFLTSTRSLLRWPPAKSA